MDSMHSKISERSESRLCQLAADRRLFYFCSGCIAASPHRCIDHGSAGKGHGGRWQVDAGVEELVCSLFFYSGYGIGGKNSDRFP